MQNEFYKDVLLELALSISGEFDLEKLLKKCMPQFLRKLDCTAAAVVNTADDKGIVLCLPRYMSRNEDFAAMLQQLAREADTDGFQDWLLLQEQDSFHYAFRLQDFGILVLSRSRSFEPFLINELLPLTAMLARACRSCLEVEKRRQAEEELSNSKALLEATLDSIPDIIGIQKPDHTMIRYNQAGYDFLGLTPEEVKGRKCYELIGRSVPCSSCTSARAVRTGRQGFKEKYLPEYDRYLECISQPVFDSQGSVHLVVEQLRDITQRKRSEKKLLTQKAQFESLFTNTSDAMVYFDADLKIFNVNTRFTEMFGHDLEEVRGRNIIDVVDPEGKETHYGAYRILAGEKVEMECTRYSRDGEPREVLLKGGPVLVDGNITGGFAVYSDISQRKNYEKEIIRARDAAEEASRAKSDFLANMSHEIRTPLNGVVSMMSLLEETSLGPEQREYVDMATISSESLLNIINDILDFSRIEAGRLELTRQNFDLEREISRVMLLLTKRARSKEVELLVDYDLQAPRRVRGDNLRLRQILYNLVGNAVKFTEKGYILVQVSLAEAGEEKARLKISVQDTGVGIPVHMQEKIFEHFTQVDYSSTRRHGGTGLGLAISRSLVRLMGGDLQVMSREGEGSTFFFELDIGYADDASEFIEDSELSGMRAMIVDDNAINRKILAGYLEKWGVEHESAADAYQALDILNQNHQQGKSFDFALVDHAMPGMDGIELASRIREQDQEKGMGLIAVSSLWGQVSSGEFFQKGFDSYLPKPVNSEDLLAGIKACLHGRKGDNKRPLQPAAPVRQENAHEVQAGPAAGAGPRILLVDDNHINRRSVQIMLKDTAGGLVSVENGQEALEKMQEDSFDLVLMDVQMPVMDGLEATRRIRSMEQGTEDKDLGVEVAEEILESPNPQIPKSPNPSIPESLNPQIPKSPNPSIPESLNSQIPKSPNPSIPESLNSQIPKSPNPSIPESRNPRIPIIALTANAMPSDREKCLSAGMTDYIAKPVQKIELLAMLKKHLPAGFFDLQDGKGRDERAGAEEDSGQPPGHDEYQVFNTRDFMDRYEQDLEIAAEIMQDFLSDLQVEPEHIQAALARHEAGDADRLAHKLKGSAGYTGAERIRLHCANIMHSSRQENWQEAHKEMQLLQREAQRFEAEARAFFQTQEVELQAGE
ncbi:multi-sensor hybrid histidine kinase [Desulfonatronospira thiodismutans ASO3-1]|uniref:Sensory/regulatory protein RpfC n=1 Tax=Desulfonatronospira thiodismutans ASO3-1 TaxID=555779 RepID=D6SSR2_9BACT|nr:response regulator [Desulfonatronospira thiodismutans]EFI33728.1 multi-sensor hybrid histidine kinase [Desulfonatronospira thiodismutans ASO3-1]